VDADDPLRLLRGGGDFPDGESGSIGSQDRIRPADFIELFKYILL
jgi:hypothetical protein